MHACIYAQNLPLPPLAVRGEGTSETCHYLPHLYACTNTCHYLHLQ